MRFGISFFPSAVRNVSIVTNAAWGFEDANGEWKTESGEWVHLPAEDAANLFLWIEHAEGL